MTYSEFCTHAGCGVSIKSGRTSHFSVHKECCFWLPGYAGMVRHPNSAFHPKVSFFRLMLRDQKVNYLSVTDQTA